LLLGIKYLPINSIAAASPNKTITKVTTAPVVRFTVVKFGCAMGWVELVTCVELFAAWDQADWGTFMNVERMNRQARATCESRFVLEAIARSRLKAQLS
jgi:hypothetical protein